MHRGHGQLEVRLGQVGDDLPGERHVERMEWCPSRRWMTGSATPASSSSLA